ncbi:hypothetical protein AB9P05_16625 [Roseivirga sp. BDSF3-8]|uniref:hypothetical protein n=1 Tax=Roseivirga sp. BDSF3-8 TaxID=3241598 RepID=UPI0035328074
MKKVEKSIDQLMSSMVDVKEDQMGMLHGGFQAVESGVIEEADAAGNFCLVIKLNIC